MIRKIKAIWELTRLEHGLMYGFGVIIGIIIADRRVLFTELSIFGFLTALLLEAGTFALNDYCDLESDIANRRGDRPLVRGDISREEALLIAIIATVFGIISASFLRPVVFLLALILAVLGILYDIKTKELLAVSNLYIAFTMAIPFIFGGLIAEPGRIDLALLILASIAFLAGLGREVMKDIGDVKGDALRDIRSIARIYGTDKARRVVILSYSLAVILSAVPFFLPSTSYFHNLAYILPVIAADAFFVHTCLVLTKIHGIEDVEYLRKETLSAIGIGLIGFLSGALF
ncbi:MAG: UbiA family prenyltransferase [Candidatus Methanospirareceae archaeon]